MDGAVCSKHRARTKSCPAVSDACRALAEGEARMFTGLRQTELGQQLLTEEEELKKQKESIRLKLMEFYG